MPSVFQLSDIWLPCLVLLVFWARPTAAFGAGNIASLSSIEGQNWRHGDIEDTLLNLLISTRTGKKFSKFDVKRVYFGNWLRDYSQAVDVGTVKMVSAEAIRILLWVLGFLSFGYGTKEFEVTRDRLGCYRPEEHIDNPKDYADNLDARDYDRRLRAPVDEERELSVDERTGLKNYIASEDLGITTSAAMVRDLLRRCIDLGRRSGGHGPDFHEALRLLGTATHCLEDYSAHSNYVELALVEMGEEDVFPHVGSNTRLYVEAAGKEVWPIVTGTFGGVDFLHSVCGEFTDKATQSELQELEGAITNADRSKNKSKIKDLLSQLPDGIFGGKDQAGKADELENNANAAAMGNVRISPKEPEEFTQQIGELVKQIYPIMEFHDDIMQAIAKFIEQIPILPELIEQIQDQITIFVFSLLAPYILPILTQVKTELEEGSSEVIKSSRDKQHVVFNDDDSSDPTHSMLSKDHFSNLLNEPAGRVASSVLTWAVPQIVECWDGEGDAEETISRIIDGVFHHPAAQRSHVRGSDRCRSIMLNTVREWWENKSDSQKDELREKLSRRGVQNGENHKPGQQDKGHGCCKPLGMAKQFTEGGSGNNKQFQQATDHVGKLASEAVGGGALGGLVGGLVGGIGGSLLGSAFGKDEKQGHQTESYGQGGSYTQSYEESGHHQKSSRDDEERYGQAEYSQTQYPGGGRREEYNRREEDEGGNSYSYEQRVSTSNYSGGGYERHEERRVQSGNEWRSEDRREGVSNSGEYYNEERERRGSGDHHRRRSPPNEGGYSSGHRREEESSYGRQENSGYGRESSGYGRQENSGYDRQESSGYGRQEGSGYGRQEGSGYGRQEGSYGGGRRQEESFGDDRMPGGFGNEEEESSYGGRRQEYGSGGGYNGGNSYDRRY